MTMLTRLFRQAPPTKASEPPPVDQSEQPQSAAVMAALDNELAVVQQAITSGDAGQLGKWAVEGTTTKVRQLAAEAIQDPVQLKELLKDVRGKDKNVYKIIRGKCDAILAQEKAAAEIQMAIAAVCAALERHSHLPFDNIFTPTLEHLCTQWQAVEMHAAPDAKASADAAIDRCREIVARHIQDVEKQAAHATAVANANANRQVVLDELQRLLLALYMGDSIAIADRLAEKQAHWTELATFKAASADTNAQFHTLCKALRETAHLINTHGLPAQQAAAFAVAAPDEDLSAQAHALKQTLAFTQLLGDSVPSTALDAADALQTWEQARATQQEAQAQAQRQLIGLIRKASGALQAGKTGPATGLRRAIEEKLHNTSNVPAHIVNQLQQLDEKLALLQDWRSYAVAPKRIELIEQMEALIGSDEDPTSLAEQIKRLQEEWKSISKGNVDNADAEWQRFHQAAQTAYQPCREFFAAQAKQRQDNLDKRAALLTRLESFAAAQQWEQAEWQADWREIARALRESRQQWRSFQPVERGPNKPLQERFDAITHALQTRLDAEYARNATEKQRLIDRVQRLLTQDDSRKAIDEVKRLQLAWKDVGMVARDDEQRLWQAFRQQCDAVFAKRQQQHSEYVSELETHKQQAMQVCEQLEQVLALSGAELLQKAKELPALREAFDAAGELPKASARELQQRFDRTMERIEKTIAQQRARDKAQSWNYLLAAGDKLRAYRLALIDALPAEECEAQKQALQSYIESIQQWPKGGLQAIKTELNKPGNEDIAANETALRTLCIRAEILTGAPTPDSDQAFRRNYQLQRLQQSMGQGQSAGKDELDAMVFEWISVGATHEAIYQELLARFTRCRES